MVPARIKVRPAVGSSQVLTIAAWAVVPAVPERIALVLAALPGTQEPIVVGLAKVLLAEIALAVPAAAGIASATEAYRPAPVAVPRAARSVVRVAQVEAPRVRAVLGARPVWEAPAVVVAGGVGSQS